MKQASYRKLWNKRRFKTNGTNNVQICIIRGRNWCWIRMSGRAKRFSAPPFRRCRSYCPVLGGGFYPAAARALMRFPRIVSCVRARENVRSCKSHHVHASHLMRSAWDRDYIVTVVIHTFVRADYPLYPPDKIEMYRPYKRGKLCICLGGRLSFIETD